MREALALLRKEWLCETRAAAGIYAVGLYTACTLFAVAFAVSPVTPTPKVGAGLLAVALLFAALVALPRPFLSEDEGGTIALLRLVARPEAAYAAKLTYGVLLMLATTALYGVAFPVLTGIEVVRPGQFAAGLALEALALASGVSLCSALAVGSRNRWTLATVLGAPILLPQVALGVGCLGAAFGEGSAQAGWQNAIGLLGFAVAMIAGGPLVVGAVWRTD